MFCLTTVCDIYEDFYEPVFLRSGLTETFCNLRFLFEAKVSKFNANRKFLKIPGSLTKHMLPANTNVNRS